MQSLSDDLAVEPSCECAMPSAHSQSSDEVAIETWLTATNCVLGRMPRRDLLDLVQRALIRDLPPRVLVHRQGGVGQALLGLLDGFVKISSTAISGREVVLEVVGPGGWLGELETFSASPRQADVMTLTQCRVLTFDRRDVLRAMARSPEGALALVDLVSHRLRLARQRVLDVIGLPAPARLAKTLMYLDDLRMGATRCGICTEKPLLSQSELGSLAGLSRESINKTLAAFRDAGLISSSRRSLTIRDRCALERRFFVSDE